jgi:hypothetical protein
MNHPDYGNDFPQKSTKTLLKEDFNGAEEMLA